MAGADVGTALVVAALALGALVVEADGLEQALRMNASTTAELSRPSIPFFFTYFVPPTFSKIPTDFATHSTSYTPFPQLFFPSDYATCPTLMFGMMQLLSFYLQG